MSIPTQNRICVELHHDYRAKTTELVMRGGGHWIKCSVLDLIVTAANRVWERGQSEHWYNHARINSRGDCQYLNGRQA
jgi:hypothetical protein